MNIQYWTVMGGYPIIAALDDAAPTRSAAPNGGDHEGH
jgi:hypothetical protein